MGNLLAGPVTPERVRVSLRLREMIRTWTQSLENEWIRKWWAEQRRLEKPEGNWPLVSPPLKMLSPDSTSYRFGQCKHKHKYNPNTNTYQNDIWYDLTLRRQSIFLVSYEVSIKSWNSNTKTLYKKHPDTSWQTLPLFEMLMHITKNAAKGKESIQNSAGLG